MLSLLQNLLCNNTLNGNKVKHIHITFNRKVLFYDIICGVNSDGDSATVTYCKGKASQLGEDRKFAEGSTLQYGCECASKRAAQKRNKAQEEVAKRLQV